MPRAWDSSGGAAGCLCKYYGYGNGFEWWRAGGRDLDGHESRNQRHQDVDDERGRCLQRSRPDSGSAQSGGVSSRVQDRSRRFRSPQRECQPQNRFKPRSGTCRGTGERDRSRGAAPVGADEPGANSDRAANRAVTDRPRPVQPDSSRRRRLAASCL